MNRRKFYLLLIGLLIISNLADVFYDAKEKTQTF